MRTDKYIRRLSYDQALEVIAKLQEFGAYGNITVGGVRVFATEANHKKLTAWLEERGWDCDISTEHPTVTNSRIIQSFKNKLQ